MDLLKLHNHFHLFPAREDKTPVVRWTNYISKKIPFKELEGSDYLGLICGVDGLEVLDLDNHFGLADKNLQFLKDNFDLTGFPIIETQNNGYHIYFTSDYCSGNTKLARKRIIENDISKHIIENDLHYISNLYGGKMILKYNGKDWETYDTIIETRGKGGYVIAPISVGYRLINGDIFNIPKLSKQQRQDLLDICKSLNEYQPTVHKEEASYKGLSPVDMYLNDAKSVSETKKILRKNGWYSADGVYWRRPGKEKGISATFGKVGKNKFYVFSSNAFPFEPESSNSMFWVKNLLEYNGNAKDCVRDLSKRYNISISKEERKKTSAKKKWDVLFKIISDWKLEFRYNELLKVTEYRREGGEYKQLGLLVNNIIYEMENNRGITSISYSKVDEMLHSEKICHVYNPIQHFFDSLPKYNGRDNFKELMQYIQFPYGEDEGYFVSMLRKHLIRAVKCGLTNYVNRMVLTFYGQQEIGKSLFFRWLVPEEIYSDETIDPSDKDSVLSLGRYLILNMDDIDSLNKREVGKLKAFISKGNITKRVSFGKSDEKFKRVATFVASTNKRELLTDESNTRWIILKVLYFDWKQYIKNIDPLQLWAEALHEFKKDEYAGELTAEEKRIRDMRNKNDFINITVEHELIQNYFTVSVNDDENIPLTSTEMLEEIINLTNIKNINRHNFGRALVSIFGAPSSKRIQGKGVQRVYYVKPLFDVSIPAIKYDEMPF